MGAAGSVPATMSRDEAREFAGERWCRVAALWPGDAESVSREEVLSMMALLRWDDIPVGSRNPLSLSANAELTKAREEQAPKRKVVPPRRGQFDVAGQRRHSIAQSNGIDILHSSSRHLSSSSRTTTKKQQSEELRVLVRAQKKRYYRQLAAAVTAPGATEEEEGECPES